MSVLGQGQTGPFLWTTGKEKDDCWITPGIWSGIACSALTDGGNPGQDRSVRAEGIVDLETTWTERWMAVGDWSVFCGARDLGCAVERA